MGFWDFFWLMLWGFFFFCYLVVLVQIVMDLFRDDAVSGWGKAAWVLALLVVPALTGLIYLVVRGSGMAGRQRARNAPVPEPDEVRVAQAPTVHPAQQIAQAKELLDSGAITPDEYSKLKAKSLG